MNYYLLKMRCLNIGIILVAILAGELSASVYPGNPWTVRSAMPQHVGDHPNPPPPPPPPNFLVPPPGQMNPFMFGGGGGMMPHALMPNINLYFCSHRDSSFPIDGMIPPYKQRENEGSTQSSEHTTETSDKVDSKTEENNTPQPKRKRPRRT